MRMGPSMAWICPLQPAQNDRAFHRPRQTPSHTSANRGSNSNSDVPPGGLTFDAAVCPVADEEELRDHFQIGEVNGGDWLAGVILFV